MLTPLSSHAFLTAPSKSQPTTAPVVEQPPPMRTNPVFTAAKVDAISLRSGHLIIEPPPVTVLVRWAELAYPTFKQIGKASFQELFFMAQEHRELRNIGAENALKPVSKMLASYFKPALEEDELLKLEGVSLIKAIQTKSIFKQAGEEAFAALKSTPTLLALIEPWQMAHLTAECVPYFDWRMASPINRNKQLRNALFDEGTIKTHLRSLNNIEERSKEHSEFDLRFHSEHRPSLSEFKQAFIEAMEQDRRENEPLDKLILKTVGLSTRKDCLNKAEATIRTMEMQEFLNPLLSEVTNQLQALDETGCFKIKPSLAYQPSVLNPVRLTFNLQNKPSTEQSIQQGRTTAQAVNQQAQAVHQLISQQAPNRVQSQLFDQLLLPTEGADYFNQNPLHGWIQLESQPQNNV